MRAVLGAGDECRPKGCEVSGSILRDQGGQGQVLRSARRRRYEIQQRRRKAPQGSGGGTGQPRATWYLTVSFADDSVASGAAGCLQALVGPGFRRQWRQRYRGGRGELRHGLRPPQVSARLL